MRTLRRGDYGPDVARLHDLLVEHHQASLDPRGVFGDDTDLKVRRFQLGNGLLADGEVGPETWAMLEKRNVTEGANE